ncbi:MAG: hypothetical protein AAGJ82_01865 [Bacteroidota bacterium]
MKNILPLAGLLLLLSSCAPPAAAPLPYHLFYLHGRIVEVQGPEAVHERFGPYEYYAILDSLRATGAVIHSEPRPADVDFTNYCVSVTETIEQLINEGIPLKPNTLK